jgi:ketosteroid isomerase-like protein
MMMSTATRGAIVLIAACAAAPLAAHPADGELNAVYGELVRARLAGDIAAMTAPFAPEAILIDTRPNPALGGGRELLAALQPQVSRLIADRVKVETEYRIERRSVVNDVAIDAGYMRMRMTRPDGQTAVHHARFLVTMRKDAAGRWRIIGDASIRTDDAAWQRAPRAAGLRYDG